MEQACGRCRSHYHLYTGFKNHSRFTQKRLRELLCELSPRLCFPGHALRSFGLLDAEPGWNFPAFITKKEHHPFLSPQNAEEKISAHGRARALARDRTKRQRAEEVGRCMMEKWQSWYFVLHTWYFILLLRHEF